MIQFSKAIEENEGREINKVFWSKFIKLSKDKSAERKSYTQTGPTVKARLLLEGTWYVSSRPLNKSNYKRVGTDASTGVKSYVRAEVFLDKNVHPYLLAYYGEGGTRGGSGNTTSFSSGTRTSVRAWLV